ncbi:32617_t:CDS:1, partial [Gigaspora margarita]
EDNDSDNFLSDPDSDSSVQETTQTKKKQRTDWTKHGLNFIH